MDPLPFEDLPPRPAAEPGPTAADLLPRAPRFKPIDRQQNVLRAFALDTLLDEDHPARAIWDFLRKNAMTWRFGSRLKINIAKSALAVSLAIFRRAAPICAISLPMVASHAFCTP